MWSKYEEGRKLIQNSACSKRGMKTFFDGDGNKKNILLLRGSLIYLNDLFVQIKRFCKFWVDWSFGSFEITPLENVYTGNCGNRTLGIVNKEPIKTQKT